MSIGSNIRRLRLLNNLTQQELAQKLGVSDKAVSTWENDKKIPRMGAIDKMSTLFGVLKSDIVEDGKTQKYTFELTPHERKVIIAYRSHVLEQATIDKILDVEPEVEEIKKQA